MAHPAGGFIPGDNRPEQTWNLYSNIPGMTNTPGADGFPGTNPGTLLTGSFVAASTSQTFNFSQLSDNQGSPIIDNFQVSAVPEPATWGLLMLGLGGLGLKLRSSRRQGAATVAAVTA